MIRIRRTLYVVAACAAVTLAGCTATATTTTGTPHTTSAKPTKNQGPQVSQQTLEQGISASLEKSVGQRPDEIDCPGPIEAKRGKSIRCVLRSGTVRYGLTATITAYNKKNRNVRYSIKVDALPQRS
jgi:uncharacterized protein DUF4333